MQAGDLLWVVLEAPFKMLPLIVPILIPVSFCSVCGCFDTSGYLFFLLLPPAPFSSLTLCRNSSCKRWGWAPPVELSCTCCWYLRPLCAEKEAWKQDPDIYLFLFCHFVCFSSFFRLLLFPFFLFFFSNLQEFLISHICPSAFLFLTPPPSFFPLFIFSRR